MTDVVRTLAEFQALLHPNIKNGMPDATVLQSQTARDLLISMPYLAEAVGWAIVDGYNYPRTPAGVRSALATGLNVYIPTGTAISIDAVANPFIPATDNQVIESSPNVQWLLPAGAVTTNVFSPDGAGSAAASVAFNANALEGTQVVPISGASLTALQATGLMADDVVIRLSQNLTDTNDPSSDEFCARCKIAAGILYIDTPFPKDFTTAKNATCSVRTLRKGVTFKGFRFYGNGNTGTIVAAIGASYCQDMTIDDVKGYDIPGSVVTTGGYNYHTVYNNIEAINCGDASLVSENTGYYAISNLLGTRGQFDNLKATRCSWGILLKGSTLCHGVNHAAMFTTGRALKYHHSRYSNWANLEGTNSNLLSGVCYSGDSDRTNFDNVQAQGNFESGLTITQIPGGTNTANRGYFRGLVLRNNAAGAHDVVVTGGNVSNSLQGELGVAPVANDSGTRTSLIGVERDIAFAAGNFTSSTGSWTVAAPQYLYGKYTMLSPTKMRLNVSVGIITTIVGAPVTLFIAIPNGRTAQAGAMGKATVNMNAGVDQPGAFCRVQSGDTAVRVLVSSAAPAFTAGADVSVTIEIEMTVNE